jgi:hypothetical protein
MLETTNRNSQQCATHGKSPVGRGSLDISIQDAVEEGAL